MINNTCIYGRVLDGNDELIEDSTVTMKYVRWDFSQVLEKEWENTTGAYQFNLGDTDMLTLAEKSMVGDVVILRNEIDGEVGYSQKLVLGLDRYYEWDIIDDGSLVEDEDEAAGIDESTNVVAKALIVNELSESLYSYYSVEVDGEKVWEGDVRRLEYIPKVTGDHKVVHWAVNATTGEISSEEYTFDVQVSGVELESVDYIYYHKRKKVVRCDLPQHVKDTLILADGWYYEAGLLMGKKDNLGQLEMDYYNGKVIIRTYIGDILDY